MWKRPSNAWKYVWRVKKQLNIADYINYLNFENGRLPYQKDRAHTRVIHMYTYIFHRPALCLAKIAKL